MARPWIKLHRQLLYNDLLRRDQTAYIVFTKLLLFVDDNGSCTAGRHQLADLLGIRGTTIYGAIRRLENAKMLTTSPTGRFTKINIVNWSLYQSTADKLADSSPTAHRQLTVTNKDKDIYKEAPVSSTEFKTFFKQKTKRKSTNLLAQAKDICNLFSEHTGGSFLNAIHINAIVGLLEQHGIDRVTEVATFALSMEPREYQVQIKKPVDLADHWPKIIELMEAPQKESKYGIRY